MCVCFIINVCQKTKLCSLQHTIIVLISIMSIKGVLCTCSSRHSNRTPVYSSYVAI